MSPLTRETDRLAYLVIGHGMIVLFIGLLAGVMLIFSLLNAVTLWPLPAWEVTVPGSTRGWQAAHVGGILNGVMIAGHVEIGDRVIFGGTAGVHQFCRVGRLAMISGLSAVGKDIPPFCTVYYMTRTIGSLNLVGLRRAGYRDHVKPLKRAFDLLFCSNHTSTRAVELIEAELGDDPLCMEMAAFVRASERGIARYAKEEE